MYLDSITNLCIYGPSTPPLIPLLNLSYDLYDLYVFMRSFLSKITFSQKSATIQVIFDNNDFYVWFLWCIKAQADIFRWVCDCGNPSITDIKASFRDFGFWNLAYFPPNLLYQTLYIDNWQIMFVKTNYVFVLFSAVFYWQTPYKPLPH